MVYQYPIPIEDDQNPCYCPSITAIAYLQSLRKPLAKSKSNAPLTRTRNSRSSRFARMLSESHFAVSPAVSRSPFLSFATLLNDSMNEDDLLMLQHAADAASNRREQDSSSSSLGTSIYSVPSWEKGLGLSPLPMLLPSPKVHKSAARRGRDHSGSQVSHASTTFSDLKGPSKRERSSMAVNESSFDLSAKAARLQFFPTGPKTKRTERFSPYESGRRRTQDQRGSLTGSEMRRKMRMLEDELYGPPIGTESPRGLKSLISRLDALLPGTRLKQKLQALDALSHQRIVDVMSMDGNLNMRVLNLLRMSEIECVDLTASMTDQEGLNLDARELLHVFAKPHSFLFLNEINLSGAKLNDPDMKYIHHLPRLARLWISNTGIGNEAVYLLVSLKRSLTELDIAFNPAITDDAVPALIVLYKLRFLTLLDTGIGMPGLRRFCSAICDYKHSIELEAPRECEIYIEKMGTLYVLQPEAPLISDPSLVSELSTKALQRNLAAHAVHNHDILAEGTKSEMAERLKRLLETREADLVVREMLWKGGDGDAGEAEDSEDESVDGDEGGAGVGRGVEEEEELEVDEQLGESDVGGEL